MSRTFDALKKAEAVAKNKQLVEGKKTRRVSFQALSVFKEKKRPITIDFDLDPYIEEQYHRLRRHLLPNSKRGAVKVVMVAATDHGEGTCGINRGLEHCCPELGTWLQRPKIGEKGHKLKSGIAALRSAHAR